MDLFPDNRSLVRHVRDELSNLIQEGDYQSGDQLPSERKLAERFAVSRPTVREALQILEKEGRIIRRVGLGTFVRQIPIVEAGLETLSSFTEMMAAQGYEAGTQYLRIDEGQLTAKEAGMFKLEPGTAKVIIERVRTVDTCPAMYSIHAVPKDLVGDIPKERYQESLFALLEEYSGILLSHAHTRVYSSLAGETIGDKLGIAPDSPLLVLDELVFNLHNQMVCSGQSHFRADFHRYHIVRRRPDTGSL